MKHYHVYKVSIFTFVFLLLLSTAAVSAPIKNVIGTGEPGDVEGNLVESKLNQPYGLAVDLAGNMIIVDSMNHKIRKIMNNKMTTLAGMTSEVDAAALPVGGYLDTDAAKAMFHLPRYAVVNAKGEIFVSDSQNHVIRRISGGKVYTLAGTGEAGYKDGDRTKAQFHTPSGLALDKEGNLYVADTLNHVIRKIDSKGNVTTFAGLYQNGEGGYVDGSIKTARFLEPNDLVFDEKGNLYVSDSGNHLIRFIADEKVTTFAGEPTERDLETGYMIGGYRNGVKEKSLFYYPKGLDYAEGILFIADSMNHRIRAVKPDGTVINIAGQSNAGDVVGTTKEAMFHQPVDVVFRKGKLYISDLYNNKIKAIELDVNNLEFVRNVEDLMEEIEFLPTSEEIQVWFDKQNITFGKEKPLIYDGGIYVPVRTVFEQWGATVEWLNETRTIQMSKNDWNIRFVADPDKMLFIEGRTFIEIDQLAQLTEFLVEWIDENRAVLIDSLN